MYYLKFFRVNLISFFIFVNFFITIQNQNQNFLYIYTIHNVYLCIAKIKVQIYLLILNKLL